MSGPAEASLHSTIKVGEGAYSPRLLNTRSLFTLPPKVIAEAVILTDEPLKIVAKGKCRLSAKFVSLSKAKHRRS